MNQERNKADMSRCAWVSDEEIYIDYHDQEWGRLNQFDNDHYLFEMLVLEGAQAGLSWITILKRREAYREAFQKFDPQKVALFEEEDIERLSHNEGIIRNERKIRSAVKNAQALLEVQEKFGSFHAYLWQFVGEAPVVNHWKTEAEVPASSSLSMRLAKDLKRRGFSFVGPVICYAYLQAIGLIQDHTMGCFLYREKL